MEFFKIGDAEIILSEVVAVDKMIAKSSNQMSVYVYFKGGAKIECFIDA